MRLSTRQLFHWCLAAVLLFVSLVAGKDYYHLLGLQRGASERQIKKAYRSLALEYHPDKVQGTAEEKEIAAAKFAEINHAYEILSDEKKRGIYDKYGEEGLKQFGDDNGHDAGDIFSQFFGGFGFGGFGGQQAEPEAPRGDDVTVHLEATLRDVYIGRSVTVSQTRNVYKEAPGTRQCNCKVKMVTRQIGPGMYQQVQKQVCEQCPNVALERESRELSIDIEPGMVNGQVVTLYEEGEAHPDGDAGDLRLVLTVLPHASLRRDGHHLHYAATISLTEALVGFSHELEHLDGHKVTLESSGVTAPGAVVRIAGEGMPMYGNEHKHGDLIVTYTVQFPDSISDSQKDTVRQLFA